MESLRKFGLLDADGKPLDERLLKVAQRSPAKFRRRFPAFQDEAEIQNSSRRPCGASRDGAAGRTDREASGLRLEGAGERRRVGPATQRDAGSVQDVSNPEPDPAIVSQLRAWDGSVEQVEQAILLRELEAYMTPEEVWMFRQKALGFSSAEIAKARGCSVNAVDQVMSRLKRKIRALAGVKE